MPDGVVLSDAITVGQVTFILRVVVQILSYGGLALIGTLILANAPRLAPIATHDVISRNVGAATTTGSTVKWLFSRLRRNPSDPYPPTNLFLALFLAVSYAGFVALSDIGFLGFFACQVPGKDIYDNPASANSTDAALKVLASNMVNGTDPNTVRAFQCSATELLDMGDNIFLDHCTSWKNSTYGDQSFFNGLNTTDSDVLMPRQLTVHHHPLEDKIYLNGYYNGLGTKLQAEPLIANGVALQPHEGGLTAVIGVPALLADHEVTLDKTIGLEVDIGCMTTGILSTHVIDARGSGRDSFSTTGNWRKFYGPEYMREVLAKTVDDVRAYWLPFFDGFSPDNEGVIYGNDTILTLSRAANIGYWRLPTANFSTVSPKAQILGNCSLALQQTLGIKNITTTKPGEMCGFVGIGGSIAYDGTLAAGFNRMVCAAATQVNMVRAKVSANSKNALTIDVTRRPSDLNYLRADYWDTTQRDANTTQYTTFDAYSRYTLSENPNGQTQHYIFHERSYTIDSILGLGSAGGAISGLGNAIIDWPADFDHTHEYSGLGLLDAGFNTLNFTLGTNMVTEWLAQIGSSYLVNSIGFNGWAAREAAPVLVVSTGGHIGTCYKAPYAIGFLPLLLAAFIVVIWSFMMLFSRAIGGSGTVKKAYGGVEPYVGTVCPGAPKETLLVWEAGMQPRLQVISKGMPVVGDGTVTALQHLKSGPAYPHA